MSNNFHIFDWWRNGLELLPNPFRHIARFYRGDRVMPLYGYVAEQESIMGQSDLEQKLAKQRVKETPPSDWYSGIALGSVTGELKAIDNPDGDNEFVIIPPAGPDKIFCVFPENLKDEVSEYLSKTVRIEGRLNYKDTSPFPELVSVEKISLYLKKPAKKTFREMRGIFSDYEKPNIDWNELLND
jgi:hypothetical protein